MKTSYTNLLGTNPHTQQDDTGNYETMTCVLIKNVEKGEFVKRFADTNKVYIKGDYCRFNKKYSLIDADDMNHEIFVPSNKAVFIGFSY